MKLLLVGISFLLLLPNFLPMQVGDKPVYDHRERFDPNLSYINSVSKLIEVSDSIAKKENITQGTLSYAIMVSTILRNRFYHGFSSYRASENWIAAAGQKYFGYGLGCIVNADEILNYSYGGCSQQSIVLMEVMKRKNIPYRSTGFAHHYALELMFNNDWYFFDPDMEPNIPDDERLERKWSCCADKLKKYYDSTRCNLDWIFGKNLKVAFGDVNATPAPKAKVFHTTTKYLSKTLWLFPLFFIFYRRKKISNRTKFFTNNN